MISNGCIQLTVEKTVGDRTQKERSLESSRERMKFMTFCTHGPPDVVCPHAPLASSSAWTAVAPPSASAVVTRQANVKLSVTAVTKHLPTIHKAVSLCHCTFRGHCQKPGCIHACQSNESVQCITIAYTTFPTTQEYRTACPVVVFQH